MRSEISSHYEVLRENQLGEVQRVRIKIVDSGPEVLRRWQIQVLGTDGRQITGRPRRALGPALAAVSWSELD